MKTILRAVLVLALAASASFGLAISPADAAPEAPEGVFVEAAAATSASYGHTVSEHCFMAAVALLNFYPQVGLMSSGRYAPRVYDTCQFLRTCGVTTAVIYYMENDHTQWYHTNSC